MSPPKLILTFPPACTSTNSACRSAKRGRSTPKRRSARYLKVRGVSVHIGSQITDVAPFGEAMARVADLVRDCAETATHRYVDAGGGLGIAYDKPNALDFPTGRGTMRGRCAAPLRGLMCICCSSQALDRRAGGRSADLGDLPQRK